MSEPTSSIEKELQGKPDTVRKRQRSPKAASQRFVPIAEITRDTVLLKGGGMRAVLQVEALNFNLKSETEQKGIIAGYESFLNTLNFPMQIVIRSTKINIDPYIAAIRSRAEKQENELLKEQTFSYALFVEKIVEVADIMQKRFYIIVPLDDTEDKKPSLLSQFFTWIGLEDSSAKASLRRRTFSLKSAKLKDRLVLVESGLHNIGLLTKRLNTEELIELYYKVYNPKTSQEQKLWGDLRTNPLAL